MMVTNKIRRVQKRRSSVVSFVLLFLSVTVHQVKFGTAFPVNPLKASAIVGSSSRAGVSKNNQSMDQPQPSKMDTVCLDPSTLPGDPSLILTTNLDLGDKKLEVMKGCSKAIATCTGKPEAYVGVAITDNAAVLFGGSDAPAALGCLYSIGAISVENNGALTKAVTELLEPFGLDASRIYINFFDVPRANVGWNKKTFAG